MKKNVLLDLSQEFAVEVIAVARILKDKGEKGFADQIKRSGTSISANIAEGNHPQSRADMISKFELALKEANETGKWLEMLLKADYIDETTINLSIKPVQRFEFYLSPQSKLQNQIKSNHTEFSVWISQTTPLSSRIFVS